MDSVEWVTSPIARQIWIMTGVYLSMIGNGMVFGITNCMLPALQHQNSTIQVDVHSGSWLTSSVAIAGMLAFFGDSALMATYGRKPTAIFALVPAVASSLVCFFATDLKVLLIGRFLSGVGSGSIGFVVAVVIGEYATPKYRGVFLNLKSCMHVVGVTIVHVLGNYLHWRTVMLAIMIPYTISLLIVCSWPESPSWLATRKRYGEAAKSFNWLRGQSEQATQELDALIKSQQEFNRNNRDKSFVEKATSTCAKFRKNNLLKPLGVYLFVAILLETSGRHVFPAYAMQIIQRMDNDKSREFLYTIAVDLIMCLSSFSSVGFVKIMKRTTLLLWSGTASALILLAVSLFYYLQSKLLISENWNALSLVLFASYFIFVNMGCIPVALTLMGEIFPLEHRSLGSLMAALFIGLFMFITLKVTPLMLVSIEIYGTFTVYGISMAFCLIVIYFSLPETKDKTLQQIEEHFSEKTVVESVEIGVASNGDADSSKLLH